MAEPTATSCYAGAATRGVLWSWVGQGFSELLWIPTAMITARLLTPAEFGVTAAASLFLMLAARLTQFGFNSSLVKMDVVKPIHLSTVFALNLAFGLLAWSAAWLVSPLLAVFFRSPETGRVLPVAALSFLAVPLGTVPGAILERQMRYGAICAVGIANGTTMAAVTIYLASVGFSYWSIVAGQLAAAIVQALVKLLLAGWTPSLRFSRDAMADVFSFGMGIYMLRLLEYAALNLDSVVVGRILGMSSLGLYDKAFNTTNRVLTRVNTGGPSVSFRIFAVICGDAERFRRAYRKVVLSSTLLTAPLFTFLAITAPQVIDVLFGPQWGGAVVPFQVLCGAAALRVLNAYACSAIEASGGVWAEVKRQVVYAVIILLGIYALQGAGVAGAAGAVLGATVIMSVLLHRVLCATTPVHWNDIVVPLVPAIAVSAAVAAVAWAAGEAVAISFGAVRAVPHLAAQACAAAIVYVLFLALYRSADVRELVSSTLGELAPMLRSAVSR